METPQNDAGRLTERIMLGIHEHIKRDPPPHESHHYNRAYEHVYATLVEALSKSGQGEGCWGRSR
uniref:Uncharacterized protein n=1 Tax=viral metagenome TaxID=1070528 RepID=A0A6M3L790_9ZZZZ